MAKEPKKRRRGRHEGGIQQLPSGSWRATLSLGKDTDGKRIRETFVRDTKREALDARAERAAALGGKLPPSAERGLTLGAWVARWLKQGEGRWDAGTVAVRRGVVGRNLDGREVCGLRLVRVRPGDVHSWLDGLSRPKDAARALALLKLALNDAVRREMIPSSPADKVRPPKTEPARRRSLTAGQCRDLVAAGRPLGIGPYLVAALDSGCRPGELLALRRRDLSGRTLDVRLTLDLLTNRSKPNKTDGSKRDVLLSAPTAAELDALPPCGPDDPLIPRPACTRPYDSWLFRRFKAAAKAAVVPWASPYTCRHTMATLLLQAGVSIAAVAARLGHSDPSITLRHYAHALPGDQERAADAIGAVLWADRHTPDTRKGRGPPGNP